MSADDTMAVRCGAWMDVAARWREEHRALRQRASSKHTRERIELRAEASRLAQCIDEIEAMLPKGSETVKARAYQTDEQFGYDRWKADEYSMGRGTHDCLIIVLPVKPANDQEP